MNPLLFSISLALSGALVILVFWFVGFLRHRRLKRDLDSVLLRVRLPLKETRDKSEEKRDPLTEIAKSAQLLSVLAQAGSVFALELAVHNVGEEINFYISVPRKLMAMAIKEVEGLWPGAEAGLAPEDYTIFNPQGAVTMASLRLKQDYILPIRTYIDAQLDTFGLILSNFTKMNAVGEGLAMQLVIKPPHRWAKKRILNYLDKLRRGDKLSDLMASELKKLFIKTKPPAPPPPGTAPLQPQLDQEGIKALEQKLAKPIYAVNIRLAASSPTPYRTTELLDGLINSFSQFSAPLRNEFKAINLRDSKSELFKFIFREFDSDESMILNADEVSSIFHFPIKETVAPRVSTIKAREAPPPVSLPKAGTLLAESVFRSDVRPVYLSDDDRRRHLYIVGQTGTGKSGLLQHLAIEDIIAGRGVAVIDPHGDLINAILSNIPESRFKDVIIFDPSDRVYPVGLNMLEYDPQYPEQKTFIVNEMLNIFDKLYDLKTTGGPMFEQYMRNALMLLMEDAINEPATLMEVPRVFTDAEFRRRKLARITNPVVIDFWEKEAIRAGGEASLQNITPYVTSKFNNFIANDYMRPIIAQPHSAFNFREILDNGKILLVNLSKGRIGDLNANLLGMIVVGKLLMAALSRVDIPQDERRDCFLYIDEFQNFTTDSIATILSEARKYRLNLVIAHQYIGQLTDRTRGAVFGNVGSILAFRVGAEDAEFLEKQFMPVFDKNDLINVDNRYAYAKLLIGGATAPPFSIKTVQVEAGKPEVREALKEMSRKIYGASREAVEAETLERLRA
jgi:hypothetical protein